MQATYDAFVEKAAAGRQHHAGEDRRGRAGPGLDRPAGEADRPGRRARRPRARAGARQGTARRSAATRKSSWWSTRRRGRSTNRSPTRSAPRSAARCCRRFLGLSDRRAPADAHRAAARLPPRRAAGDHAERVRAANHGFAVRGSAIPLVRESRVLNRSEPFEPSGLRRRAHLLRPLRPSLRLVPAPTPSPEPRAASPDSRPCKKSAADRSQ